MSVINLNSVSKSIDGNLLLSPTTLQIEKGDFFALVGGRDSGKSVVLDILMNFLRPTGGTAEIWDTPCTRLTSAMKKKIGYCPKEPDFRRSMRVGDILRMCAKIRGVKNTPKIKELCTTLSLNTRQRIYKTAASEKKKLGIIIAMLHSPELILLDCPFFGLDRKAKHQLKELLIKLHNEGVTILMTHDSAAEAEEICSRIATIHHGSLLDVNESDMLLKSVTRHISIKTEDDISALLTLFKINDVTEKKGYISFTYKNDINDLIRALTSYKIEDLQISLPELEDVILDYYNEHLEDDIILEQPM